MNKTQIRELAKRLIQNPEELEQLLEDTAAGLIYWESENSPVEVDFNTKITETEVYLSLERYAEAMEEVLFKFSSEGTNSVMFNNVVAKKKSGYYEVIMTARENFRNRSNNNAVQRIIDTDKKQV